jgi:inorganic pyrophosphatase
MKAIIEIPKGDDRRRHVKYDKSGFIDLGPTKDVIPINKGIMPIHYGYIPETFNQADDDEIDILVLSDKILKVGQEIEVKPIALIKRADKDDKIVAVDEMMMLIKGWDDIPKEERELVENFFSYHHKFLSVENSQVAKQYFENGRQQFLLRQKKL